MTAPLTEAELVKLEQFNTLITYHDTVRMVAEIRRLRTVCIDLCGDVERLHEALQNIKHHGQDYHRAFADHQLDHCNEVARAALGEGNSDGT